MIEFLKKMMDWALSKEEELAKNCQINSKDIDEQIHKVLQKKVELEQKYKDEISQINKLIDRLEKIKEQSQSCKN